jgi:hypothetical protein
MVTTVAFLGLIVMLLGPASCAYALYLIENGEHDELPESCAILMGPSVYSLP